LLIGITGLSLGAATLTVEAGAPAYADSTGRRASVLALPRQGLGTSSAPADSEQGLSEPVIVPDLSTERPTTYQQPDGISEVVRRVSATAAPFGAGQFTDTIVKSHRILIVNSKLVLEINGVEVDRSNSPQVPATFPPTGRHRFVKAHPYWAFQDGNEHGTEYITYDTPNNLREQWGYQASGYIIALAGGPFHQIANLHCNGVLLQTYAGHIEPAGYHFHGSYGILSNACEYHTYFQANFKTQNGGDAVLRAQWNWYIVT